uniref:Uncharacterized protein n=1 Tax=Strigamia maritima TaxID=126957 RepID=T1JIU2_STRMM
IKLKSLSSYFFLLNFFNGYFKNNLNYKKETKLCLKEHVDLATDIRHSGSGDLATDIHFQQQVSEVQKKDQYEILSHVKPNIIFTGIDKSSLLVFYLTKLLVLVILACLCIEYKFKMTYYTPIGYKKPVFLVLGDFYTLPATAGTLFVASRVEPRSLNRRSDALRIEPSMTPSAAITFVPVTWFSRERFICSVIRSHAAMLANSELNPPLLGNTIRKYIRFGPPSGLVSMSAGMSTPAMWTTLT